MNELGDLSNVDQQKMRKENMKFLLFEYESMRRAIGSDAIYENRIFSSTVQ